MQYTLLFPITNCLLESHSLNEMTLLRRFKRSLPLSADFPQEGTNLKM
jgi:hypothetical protein